MRLILFVISVGFIFTSCKEKKVEERPFAKKNDPQNQLILHFEGYTNCADCDSLFVVLDVNSSDSTYSLSETRLGKKEEPVLCHGHFTQSYTSDSLISWKLDPESPENLRFCKWLNDSVLLVTQRGDSTQSFKSGIELTRLK